MTVCVRAPPRLRSSAAYWAAVAPLVRWRVVAPRRGRRVWSWQAPVATGWVRGRGRGGQGGAGGEEQDGGADQAVGGGLGQRQRRQVRGRHPAQPGQHLQGDGDGQERPAGPGDHGQDAQRQGAVVAGWSARSRPAPGWGRGRGSGWPRSRAAWRAGRPAPRGWPGWRSARSGGRGWLGHCSTPPTDRVMRAWPWPVTVIEVIPMMPRNVVS